MNSCITARQALQFVPAMSDRVQCFVAYPSEPESRAESIELAIREILSGGVVEIAGWRSVAVGGRIVINAICERIRRCQLFIADVTGLNPNVLFELGYAIALNKRVWLLIDPNIERSMQDFNSLQLLTTIGYAPFSHSRDIVSVLYKEEPYNSLEKTVLSDLLGHAEPRRVRKQTLLHLKPNVDTEAAVRIARRVAAGIIPSVIDDPKEAQTQPLSWYVQHVTSSFAVTCQFLSTDYKNWELLNAKQALVAGLAYGSGKPLLMLAQDPYVPPIDYRDILRKHKTAAAAEAIYNDWLLPIVEAY
jgi:hypothetical protein